MSLFCRLSRRHYWCTPHRTEDHRLVQVCYECGAERAAREFHNEMAAEWYNQSLTAAKKEMARLSAERVTEEVAEPIAIGQNGTRKFALVK